MRACKYVRVDSFGLKFLGLVGQWAAGARGKPPHPSEVEDLVRGARSGQPPRPPAPPMRPPLPSQAAVAAGSKPPSTTSILRQQRMPHKPNQPAAPPQQSAKASNFGLSKPAAPRRSSVEAGSPLAQLERQVKVRSQPTLPPFINPNGKPRVASANGGMASGKLPLSAKTGVGGLKSLSEVVQVRTMGLYALGSNLVHTKRTVSLVARIQGPFYLVLLLVLGLEESRDQNHCVFDF